MSSILLTASRKYPAIPTVGGDVVSHTKVLEALRDAVQIHERRTGDRRSSFVRIKDLIDLGVVRLVGDNRIELAVVSDTGTGGGGATALADLTDVDVSGVTDGDSLVYDSGSGLWVPQAVVSSDPFWTNIVTNSFSANTTGFTSNGTGSWAVANSRLEQTSNTTNGAAFYYNTVTPYAALRVQCEMQMVSAGAGSTTLTTLFAGPNSPAAIPTNSFDMGLRYNSGTKTIEIAKFGVGFSLTQTQAYNRDQWYPIKWIVIGTRHVLYFDSAVVGSVVVSDGDFVGFQKFGMFTYGGASYFRNFSIDVGAVA